MSAHHIPYIGRFAPSPTGPLHFGSLVAATASYLDARSHGGKWLLRMEDLDTPRTVPGAAAAILETLEAYAFEWDGEILYQSQRDAIYQAFFDRLEVSAHTFPCACARKDIADRYPGTCRNGLNGRPARSHRLRVTSNPVTFIDRLQGPITTNLEEDCGDYVLRRADGIWSYQLAVVVDDHLQNVTHIVRGADLLDSTPRQIYLQRCLSIPTPSYLHIPAATNEQGEKLSKQTFAPAITARDALPTLRQALRFLNHEVPRELAIGSLKELWRWALRSWDPARLPRSHSLPAS